MVSLVLMLTVVSGRTLLTQDLAPELPRESSESPLLNELWTDEAARVLHPYDTKPFTAWWTDERGFWLRDLRTGADHLEVPIGDMKEGDIFPSPPVWDSYSVIFQNGTLERYGFVVHDYLYSEGPVIVDPSIRDYKIIAAPSGYTIIFKKDGDKGVLYQLNSFSGKPEIGPVPLQVDRVDARRGGPRLPFAIGHLTEYGGSYYVLLPGLTRLDTPYEDLKFFPGGVAGMERIKSSGEYPIGMTATEFTVRSLPSNELRWRLDAAQSYCIAGGLIFVMQSYVKWSAYGLSEGALVRSHVSELDGFTSLRFLDTVLIATKSSRGDLPAVVKGFRVLP